ncbi:MAG: phosphodiester glycosidase family protein, partial [Synechococcales cyanobacterium T60_A2020_003]|nr:phosphodiester glycosidase family protein [Synechococcales cyanobacterium T60_A2020_003]
LIPVTSLEIDPDEPVLDMRPIWAQPTTIEGIQPLRTIAQQAQAIAAINGGFFNRNNQLPLGAIRHNGEWISGPILNRGAIAWTDDGEFQFGSLSLQETLETDSGTVVPLKHLNSGYVQAGVSRYTPSWGTSYSPLTDYETIVTIQGDQVIQQQRFEHAGQNRVAIPADGYILAVRSYNSILESLAVGTQVHLNTATTPESFATYPEILGAGPLLLQNRQVVLNAQLEQFSDAFIQQKASRSAIGLTDQDHILLVTVHNQSDGSGVSLTQMAEIMRNLGTIDALNLDGGSSTTLTLGSRLLNVNPESVARVNNGIGIFLNLDSEAVETP